MIEQKRKPSQDDDLLQQADESLAADPMDITALETDKPSNRPSIGQDRTAETIGRMVAGATPTLFGFLFGPQQSERGIAQTQKFYAGGKPSKLVPVVGEEGKPIYATPEEALGQEAYQKPSNAYGSSGKWIPGKTWTKNDKGVEQLVDTLTNNASGAVIHAITKEPITAARSYITPKTYITEDIRGGKNINVIDPSMRGSAMINKETAESGLGSFYGVKTKGQAKTIEKGFEEGQKQSQTLASSLVDIQSAKDTLKKSKDPREVAQAIYSMVRSVETKGVLTDQDFENITGSNMKSYLSNLEYRISTKAFGDVEGLRNSYLDLANAIERKTANKLGSLSRTYAPSTKQAQEAFKSVVPISNKAQAHPQASAAVEWARKNPKDSRSKEILKALGEK